MQTNFSLTLRKSSHFDDFVRYKKFWSNKTNLILKFVVCFYRNCGDLTSVAVDVFVDVEV